MKNKKKKKEEFIDDGRVIADMDIEGMPHRINSAKRKRNYDLSKEEKRHLILAGYKAFFPVLICGLLGMGFAMLIIMLWLHII